MTEQQAALTDRGRSLTPRLRFIARLILVVILADDGPLDVTDADAVRER